MCSSTILPSPFENPPYSIVDGVLSRFNVSVSDDEIQKLSQLIKLSPIAVTSWENSKEHAGKFGLTRDWLIEASRRWSSEEFDWRKREAAINTVPQFKIDIIDKFESEGDGKTYGIHFAALFSKKKDAVPILFLHGWPGSFYEFFPIMQNVKAEYADKPAELPYHIIAPSLTGFGFSDPPPKDRDFRIVDQARLLMKMMRALGFGKDRAGGFVVQGGDIGAFVAITMAVRYEDVRAIHTNFLLLDGPPENLDHESVTYSLRELDGMNRLKEFWANGSDYARLHANRPSTVGMAIGSSPIALVSWIGEKMIAWSDPATAPDLDVILTNVSLYWFSGTYATSIWHYRDLVDPHRSKNNTSWEGIEGKPFGFSSFPKETTLRPRAWLDAIGKLTWYKENPQGGHFAALEQPRVLWGDVVDFIEFSRAQLPW